MGIAMETTASWWAVFEDGRFDELPTLVRPDAEIVMPGGMRFRGPMNSARCWRPTATAFPDVHHEIVSTIETADAIALELRITMTHTGVFATPMGDLPPTGHAVGSMPCDMVRVAADGRITSWHSYFDQASLVAQLGVQG